MYLEFDVLGHQTHVSFITWTERNLLLSELKEVLVANKIIRLHSHAHVNESSRKECNTADGL